MDSLVEELGIVTAGLRGARRSCGGWLRDAPRQFWTFWVCFVVGGLLLVLLTHAGQVVAYNSSMKESKKNLHDIQLAVERYAVDTEGSYPQSPALLVEQGYLEALPVNPFTMQPMRWVIGESHAGAQQRPEDLYHGDFAYVPMMYDRNPPDYEVSAIGAEEVDSYYLVLY